jgi:hypothetical protein
MRRRRRFVFVSLLELTGLTLIMGLFQPFRAILVLTTFLACVVVLYVAVLLRFRAVELAQADGRRAAAVAQRQMAYAVSTNGSYGGRSNGNGNGYGNGNGNGHGSSSNGNGGYENGYASHDVLDEGYLPWARLLSDGGIQIIDEDVHVIVRRSDEVDLQALRAANGSTAE